MSATSFADAKARRERAQAGLDEVHAAKRSAATKDPQGDTFAENAAKAKRERWTGGTLGNQQTPRQ
jgi:hypothetical protein